MIERIKEYKDNYIYNKTIDMYHFFTKDQIENKLGYKIEPKKYTLYEYDELFSGVFKYYKIREELSNFGITDKEYDDLLEVFDRISKEYKL